MLWVLTNTLGVMFRRLSGVMHMMWHMVLDIIIWSTLKSMSLENIIDRLGLRSHHLCHSVHVGDAVDSLSNWQRTWSLRDTLRWMLVPPSGTVGANPQQEQPPSKPYKPLTNVKHYLSHFRTPENKSYYTHEMMVMECQIKCGLLMHRVVCKLVVIRVSRCDYSVRL